MALRLEIIGGGAAALIFGASLTGGLSCCFVGKLIDILTREILAKFFAHLLHPAGYAAGIIFIQAG
jgi:hypothetical protein